MLLTKRRVSLLLIPLLIAMAIVPWNPPMAQSAEEIVIAAVIVVLITIVGVRIFAALDAEKGPPLTGGP